MHYGAIAEVIFLYADLNSYKIVFGLNDYY